MKWLLPEIKLPTGRVRTVMLLQGPVEDAKLEEERKRRLAAAKRRSRSKIGRRGW